MSRKTKTEEMQDGLKDYKAYLCEADFIAYKLPVCVLAANVVEARVKLDDKFPGMRTTIINQLTEVIV